VDAFFTNKAYDYHDSGTGIFKSNVYLIYYNHAISLAKNDFKIEKNV